MKKYLTFFDSLNYHNVDWHQNLNKDYIKPNKILKTKYIVNNVANPSRAFIDLLLNKKESFDKKDLFKNIEREFEITDDIAKEFLELAWLIYQKSKHIKRINFKNTKNSPAEFLEQLGPTFNKMYHHIIVDFNF